VSDISRAGIGTHAPLIFTFNQAESSRPFCARAIHPLLLEVTRLHVDLAAIRLAVPLAKLLERRHTTIRVTMTAQVLT
jgi:hypothetical protein